MERIRCSRNSIGIFFVLPPRWALNSAKFRGIPRNPEKKISTEFQKNCLCFSIVLHEKLLKHLHVRVHIHVHIHVHGHVHVHIYIHVHVHVLYMFRYICSCTCPRACFFVLNIHVHVHSHVQVHVHMYVDVRENKQEQVYDTVTLFEGKNTCV
jgi:hypothetical protein